jgi:hypothetical protein
MISRALLLPNNTFLLGDMKAVSLISYETKPYRYTARTIKPSKAEAPLHGREKIDHCNYLTQNPKKNDSNDPENSDGFILHQIDFNAIDSIIAAEMKME